MTTLTEYQCMTCGHGFLRDAGFKGNFCAACDAPAPVAAVKHQIKWFVYAGGQKIARTATMRGSWDGYDAECTCGWATHTGGAVKVRVDEAVHDHKWEVANGWWHPQGIEFSAAAIAARKEAGL